MTQHIKPLSGLRAGYANISLGLRISYLGDGWALLERTKSGYVALQTSDNRDEILAFYQHELELRQNQK